MADIINKPTTYVAFIPMIVAFLTCVHFCLKYFSRNLFEEDTTEKNAAAELDATKRDMVDKLKKLLDADISKDSGTSEPEVSSSSKGTEKIENESQGKCGCGDGLLFGEPPKKVSKMAASIMKAYEDINNILTEDELSEEQRIQKEQLPEQRGDVVKSKYV